jgi:hypothetical protein
VGTVTDEGPAWQHAAARAAALIVHSDETGERGGHASCLALLWICSGIP